MMRWLSAHVWEVVAVDQVFGSGFAVAYLLPALFTPGNFATLSLGEVALAALPPVTLVAGVLIWAHRPSGLWLSIVVQALQVLQVESSKVSFAVLLGPKLRLLCVPSEGRVGPDFGMEWQGALGFAGPEQTLLAVNLLPVVLLYFLVKNRTLANVAERTHEATAA